MREPSVHVNIHANDSGVQFQPVVTDLESGGKEVIAVHLETVRVFLNRDRLHQLKDVLVAACETYPIETSATISGCIGSGLKTEVGA